MHTFCNFSLSIIVLFLRCKLQMASIMRKMSRDAAEFCLLSASSQLPLLSAGTLEGDDSDSGNIYCLGNIKNLIIFHPQSGREPLHIIRHLISRLDLQNIAQDSECRITKNHYAFLFFIISVVQIRAYQKRNSLRFFFFPRIHFRWSSGEISTVVFVGRMPYLNHNSLEKTLKRCTLWLSSPSRAFSDLFFISSLHL